MVVESSARLGIDIRGTSARLAQVEYGSARPLIQKLARVESSQINPDDSISKTIAVDDADAIIKEIKLPTESKEQLIEKAQFELRHRLLDPPEQFRLETIPTGRETRFIGTAIRHEVGQNQASGIGITYEKNATCCRVRSLALGLGYLNFCSDRSESFCCLIDFDRFHVSICFLYRSGIVALDHISSEQLDLNRETDHKRAVIDFRTLLNYRLNTLFEDGLTLPLSEILVCSDPTEQVLTERLALYFKVPISTPELNQGYFAETVDRGTASAADFLIALGLTVK